MVETDTQDTCFTPDPQSGRERAAYRHACPHGTTCTHSGTHTYHQPAYLEGLALEAGGLPENTDHLSTMLVIEKKGQVPKGLLGKSRT